MKHLLENRVLPQLAAMEIQHAFSTLCLQVHIISAALHLFTMLPNHTDFAALSPVLADESSADEGWWQLCLHGMQIFFPHGGSLSDKSADQAGSSCTGTVAATWYLEAAAASCLVC